MKTFSTVAIVIMSLLAAHAWAGTLTVNGNVAINSNITAQSISVGSAITTTNTTSIGAAGQVVMSTLWGSTNVFGIMLNSGNAAARVDFVDAGNGGGGFGFYSQNLGYLGSLWVRSEDQWLNSSVYAGFREEGPIEAYGNLTTWGDAEIDGKLTVYGGMDPPYLLLDSGTRATVAQRVASEVPLSKQTGAALFWNSSAKQLEVYVASEGAFYNLAGNLVANITPPTLVNATVKKTYHLDAVTGQVIADESITGPRWHVKSGYRFDKTTGVFFKLTDNNAPPLAVSQDEALELK